MRVEFLGEIEQGKKLKLFFAVKCRNKIKLRIKNKELVGKPANC